MNGMRHQSPIAAAAFVVGCAALGAAGLACSGDPQPAAIAVDEGGGALTVIAGTFDRPCKEAKSIVLECGRWEIAVHLQLAAQSGGPKPLASADTSAENLVSDGKVGGLECSVIGGTFEKGTIE